MNNDPALHWSGVDQPLLAGYEMFDDYPDDDLMMVSAEPGSVQLHEGHGAILESPDVLFGIGAVGIATIEPKVEAPPVRLAKPPRIWWSGVLRLIMSTKRYQAEVETEILEMREEYYECIARGDERGAALVVIRWNIAVVPRWVWGHAWCWVWQIIDWLKG
jgi:hypothetical protein